MYLNHYYAPIVDDGGNLFTTSTCKTRCSELPECIAISFERTTSQECCLLHGSKSGSKSDLVSPDLVGGQWECVPDGVDEDTIDGVDTLSSTPGVLPMAKFMK